jgi:hypothetical protein
MESVAQLVYPVLDQAVALIEKFSFLGVDSHIVKSAYLVCLIFKYLQFLMYPLSRMD